MIVRPTLLALLVAATGCGSAAVSPPSTDIPSGAVDLAWNDAGAVHLAHEYYSGLRQPRRTVIDDDAQWRALWVELYANQRPVPAIASVDFARYSVIVAALGERGTGGYDIRIARLAVASDYLYAEITSTVPGSNCGTTQALTQPVDVVRIPKPHKPVTFLERRSTRSC